MDDTYWTEQDAANLRQFMTSITGQRLVRNIQDNTPEIDSSGIEAAALSAQRILQREDDKKLVKRLRDFQATKEYRGPNWVRVTDLDEEPGTTF